MVNELLGIQYNIAKANVTDRKVQNLASYINVNSLRAIHRTMDKNKASGIDKVTKEEYEQNLEENLENLVKRMKNGSYRPNPTRRVYMCLNLQISVASAKILLSQRKRAQSCNF